MLNNIHLKIFSVISAIILWFIVITSDHQEVSFYVPVKLKNFSKGHVAVTESTLVSVLVKGPKLATKNIAFNEIKLEVDTSELTHGDSVYRIKLSDIKVPSGITVLRVDPNDIKITVDKLSKKEVEISPFFVGEAANGYKITEVKIVPEKVWISGALNKIKKIDFVETLPINITAKDKDTTFSTSVKKSEGILSVTPEQFDITVKFSEDIVEKELIMKPEVMIKTKDAAKYTVIPEKVKVFVKGRKDIVEHGDSYIRIFVDVDGALKNGVNLKNVKHEVENDEIEVLMVKPDKVKLEVKK